jgi:hypothetical protein
MKTNGLSDSVRISGHVFSSYFNQRMYDLIGDIHGYAERLELLLQKMGYSKRNGVYHHPERKVLFIGDYIDRGPQIRET